METTITKLEEETFVEMDVSMAKRGEDKTIASVERIRSALVGTVAMTVH